MKNHREAIVIRTKTKEAILDITAEVARIVRASGIREGLALVISRHTSSGVFLNDSDASVTADLAEVLHRLVPPGAGYRHDDSDPKRNADGHLKAALTNHGVTLAVTNGDLDLGAYQTIYYAEFDGGRPKGVLVKIIGE